MVHDVKGRPVRKAEVVVERAAGTVRLSTGAGGGYSAQWESVSSGSGQATAAALSVTGVPSHLRVSVTGNGFEFAVVEAVVPLGTTACRADVTLFKKGQRKADSQSGVVTCEKPAPQPYKSGGGYYRLKPELMDQAQLTRVALDKDNYFDVREEATRRLTDQALLAKIAVEDEDSRVRTAAVEKVTDQAVLAKIATEDGNRDVRQVAVNKLTDQAVLAKIALDEKEGFVQAAAVKKLTDQAALAKVALGQHFFSYVREAAVQKLTDQAVLARLASMDYPVQLGTLVGTTEPSVHFAAIERLTDQALLAKIAVVGTDPNDKSECPHCFRQTRAAAIANLTDQTLLAKLAGDIGKATYQSDEAVSRIRLALEDPIVMTRIPNAKIGLRFQNRYQDYRFSSGRGSRIYGEGIDVIVRLGAKVLAKDDWETHFPNAEDASTIFISASIDLSIMMRELFSQPEFTREDLLRLTQSRIPEVRAGALADLAKASQK
jgi:hypothetical protein